MELRLQGSSCFVTTSSAHLVPVQKSMNALLLPEICLFLSAHQGWHLLSEQVPHSGAIFQAETFQVSYCSHHDKDPFDTCWPPTKAVLPKAGCSPVLFHTPARHSLTWHRTLSEQTGFPMHSKNPNQQLSKAAALLALGLDTPSKSSQAMQHLSHNTGRDCSKTFSFEQTLVQGLPPPPAAGIQQPPLLLTHTKCSERAQTSSCRKLQENRFPLLRTSALKKIKLADPCK